MRDAPSEDTVAGLRDRAILSVVLQIGLRSAEISALKVGDLHQNRGFDSPRVSGKGRPSRRARHQSTDRRAAARLSGGPRGTAPTSTSRCSGR